MTTPAVTATDSLSPIAARFASLREQGRMALMPFLMAGDPDLSTTAEVLLSLQAQGADMVELGIPYSDPLACLLYTSPSPRDLSTSRMPSSA